MESNQSNIPIIFLGIAEEVKSAIAPYPVGQLNIFGLTQHSRHFMFPVPIKDFKFLFAVEIAFLKKNIEESPGIKIQVKDSSGAMFCDIGFNKYETSENQPATKSNSAHPQSVLVHADLKWQLLSYSFDVSVAEPHS